MYWTLIGQFTFPPGNYLFLCYPIYSQTERTYLISPKLFPLPILFQNNTLLLSSPISTLPPPICSPASLSVIHMVMFLKEFPRVLFQVHTFRHTFLKSVDNLWSFHLFADDTILYCKENSHSPVKPDSQGWFKWFKLVAHTYTYIYIYPLWNLVTDFK